MSWEIHLHGQFMKNRFSDILEILLIVNYEKLQEKSRCKIRIHTSRDHHHNTTLLLSYYSLWPKGESISKSSRYHFMCDLSVYYLQKNEREDTGEKFAILTFLHLLKSLKWISVFWTYDIFQSHILDCLPRD